MFIHKLSSPLSFHGIFSISQSVYLFACLHSPSVTRDNVKGTLLLALSVLHRTLHCAEFNDTNARTMVSIAFLFTHCLVPYKCSLLLLLLSVFCSCLFHTEIWVNASLNRYRHDRLSFVATGREAVIMMKLILAVLLVTLAVGKSVIPILIYACQCSIIAFHERKKL